MTEPELAKHLETMAVIDCCYFMIAEIQKNLPNRTSLDLMIDEATGFEKDQGSNLKGLVEQVIENKKQINVDYSGDQKFLDSLNWLVVEIK